MNLPAEETIEPSPPPNTDNSSRWVWLRTTLIMIVVVTVIRGVLNFRHELAPGMDAAYYPMQTRWFIEQGELFWDAPPLIFWIIAALTQLSHHLFGMSIDDGCLFYSRLVDVIIPPWVALPIMMLGYRWASGRREALAGCAAATLLATMSPPIMRMASDFQKNSVGLVLMALAMWAMNQALTKKNGVLPWVCLGGLLLLSAITHIGAFGVTCVMVGGTAIGHVALSKSTRSWRATVIALLSVLIGSAVSMFLLTVITPEWANRLLELPTRAMGMFDPRGLPISIVVSSVVYGILFFIVRRVWNARSNIDSADGAVVMGCIAGFAVLFTPGLEGPWTMRFLLMTPVPGAILLAFWISRLIVTERATWQPKALTIAAAVLAIVALFSTQGPVITTDIAEEMNAFGQQLDQPSKTLIVAPHGVEFWAGVTMHTQATQTVVPQKISGYRQVLVLVPKGDFGRPGPSQSQGRGPGGPTGHNHPGHPPRLQDEVTVPKNSLLIYDGEHFRVFEVKNSS